MGISIGITGLQVPDNKRTGGESGDSILYPSELVWEKLRHVDFEIATLEQMMSLLGRVDSEYACALLESQFPSHLSRYA
jgi:hypothetical protein